MITNLILQIIIILTFNQDITLSVCQYANGVYQFGFTGDAVGWSFTDAIDYDLEAMTASGEGVQFTVYHETGSQTIYGYPDAPRCAENVWQPSAPSIHIPAPSDDWFKIEIQDVYGHWSLVTDYAHPDGIVLRSQAGSVELIGSVGQDIDPAHYRLTKVA